MRQVAEASLDHAPAVIRRQDGARVVTVTADVDKAVITSPEASGRLREEIMPRLTECWPELRWSFGCEEEERRDTQGAIASAFLIGLVAISQALREQLGQVQRTPARPLPNRLTAG